MRFKARAHGSCVCPVQTCLGVLCFVFAVCRQALKQMGGALRDMYEEWRHQLKGCLAHAEAVIDFGDDEVNKISYPHLRLLIFCPIPLIT